MCSQTASGTEEMQKTQHGDPTVEISQHQIGGVR